jgi:hypothetical protein
LLNVKLVDESRNQKVKVKCAMTEKAQVGTRGVVLPDEKIALLFVLVVLAGRGRAGGPVRKRFASCRSSPVCAGTGWHCAVGPKYKHGKESPEALRVASRDFDLEVNADNITRI